MALAAERIAVDRNPSVAETEISGCCDWPALSVPQWFTRWVKTTALGASRFRACFRPSNRKPSANEGSLRTDYGSIGGACKHVFGLMFFLLQR